MSDEVFNASEQELERTIAKSDGVIAVFLSEPFHPGARVMAERVQHLSRDGRAFQVIDVSLAAYRTWAASYDAYGTPAILFFENGKLVSRVLGVVEEEVLGATIS
ncbi:MAG TPA: thioredoxin family protein [Candidatus Sumerlaeota bacterium]|nr:thioredoxin family protein [Candidatus Sumerlaeota bacterium]HNM45439.1 thioredoxin family protein [Candidatus Sumerlaeota bacterium]